MRYLAAAMLFYGSLSAQTDSLERLTALTQKMAAGNEDPCVYAAEFRRLWRAVAAENPEMASSLKPMENLISDCKASDATKVKKVRTEQPEPPPQPAPEVRRPQPAPVGTPHPSASPTLTSHQLEAIKGSVGRVQLTAIQFESLLDLARQLQTLGHVYIEKKKGSILEHTNRKDDTEADKDGFHRRESANFIVYYRGSDEEGGSDMVRAKTTLQFAEDSKVRIAEVLKHFPESNGQAGDKLVIYILKSQAEFLKRSGCADFAIACVVPSAFKDGMKSKAYINPSSFHGGATADDRISSYRQTITHELTHYAQFDLITPANLPNVRSWLLEGVATYTAGEMDCRAPTLRASVRNRDTITWATLASASNPEVAGKEKIGLFYAESGAIISMIATAHGQGGLTDFILSASQDVDAQTAIQRQFGQSPDEFSQYWSTYLEQKYSGG